MANFTHTYREEQIPGASQSGVITAHTPGRLIAKAVTELQERVVTDVNVEGKGVEDAGSDVTDNILNLRLRVDVPEIEVEGLTGNVNTISGGQWPLLTIQRLEVENGLIKSVESDEGAAYPDKELYSGPVIVSQTVTTEGGNIQFTINICQCESGVIVSGQTQETITIPSLPSGLSASLQCVDDVRYNSGTRQFEKRIRMITVSNGIITESSVGSYSSFLTLQEFSC
jgi:hypothetical protein